MDIHFIDSRRDVGQRGDVRQFPVICAADIVEDGVTDRPADVTCDDCASRLNYGQRTTTWKIDGRDVEIAVPVSAGVECAQARFARDAANQKIRTSRTGRRIRADG